MKADLWLQGLNNSSSFLNANLHVWPEALKNSTFSTTKFIKHQESVLFLIKSQTHTAQCSANV
jgi:hypothetical protein